MSKILCTLVFILTITTNIFAQGAGGISGTVVDENNSKIAGAQVVLRSSSGINLTASTDQGGAFKFEGLRSGSYFIEVKA
ncbi:MAG TPA: carboxypeptidase-like regulatory domain-containing protein, partial [Pyrinomonadaceae bacterium]|nr:carboxypeptidase-like regulatory domain-containing protein [Pyrinomonadaceae bacterium]